MKKKYTILAAGALLAAALLISACSHSEQPITNGDPTSESTTAPVETPDPEESADSPDSPSSPTQEEAVTAAPEDASQLWTETEVDITMYVASDNVSSLKEALQHSAKVTTYRINERLHLIALTDTGFYKLENGEYISKDDLSETEAETFISSVDATIYTTTPAKE